MTPSYRIANIVVIIDMKKPKSEFVVIDIVQGELAAQVIKSHLESEDIPVILKYESAGIIYGVTLDGLGEVRILVPKEFTKEAKEIIKSQE
ncbi:putative signal transducing protein [Chloroflexota bacterium]